MKNLLKVTFILALIAGFTFTTANTSAAADPIEFLRAPKNSHIKTEYNSATKELIITVQSKSKEYAKFYVTDQRGFVYINETILFTGNRQVINMPLNSLATGGYHVKIVSKSIAYSRGIKKY